MSTLLRRYLLALPVIAAVAAATLLTGSERSQESPIKVLGRVAVEYKSYGRVDEGRGHWTPIFCVPPTGQTAEPGVARFSESDDQSIHGRKIYFLFAKDAEAYGVLRTPQPVGQILVKEAWIPRRMHRSFTPNKNIHREYDSDGPPLSDESGVRGGYFPYAEDEGRWYRAGERAGLFVMMKFGAETPETDNGWIYGTVDRDAKVTSCGRIASCMECHEQSQHDRLFGLPLSILADVKDPREK